MMKHHLLAMLFLFGPCLSAQTRPGWKPFENRGGWIISYPKDWKATSCRTCEDPTEPGVEVDFYPPGMKIEEGWVMVEPLQDKPSGMADDDWLAKISMITNVNEQVHKESMTLNGISALKVRYLAKDGEQMESVYVVAGLRTFALEFCGDLTGNRANVPLERFRQYRRYLEMVDTFRITAR